LAQQYGVDIVAKVLGTSKIKRLEGSLKGTAAAAVKADSKLDGFSAASNKAGRSASSAKKGVQNLSVGFQKLAVAIGAADIARRAFTIGLKSVGAGSRLAALTGQYGEYEQALARVQSIQSKYNLTQSEASTQFSTAYARLKPLGFSLNEIQEAYEGITTATKIAQLDAGAANALFTQTAQALGSGIVQAEELNTIIDQAPSIVVALAEELGVAAGQVKKLASDGKVSSEALLKALKRVKTEGADQVAAALLTPAERIKSFQVVTEQVVNRLLGGVIADLADGIGDISEAIKDLYPAFSGLGVVAQAVMRPIIALFKAGAEVAAGFGRAVKNASEGNWKALLEPDTEGLENLKGIFNDMMAPLDANLPKPPKGNRTSTRTPYSSSGGGSGSGAGAALQDDTGSAQEMLRLQEQEFDVLRASTDLERELLGIENEREDALKQISEFQNISPGLRETLEANESLLASNKKNEAVLEDVLGKTFDQTAAAMDALRPLEEQKQILEGILQGRGEEVRLQLEIERILKAAPGLERAKVEELVKGNAELEKQAEQAAELDQLYDQVGQRIMSGLVDGITAAIDGSKDLQDILSDVLKDLGRMFLNAGMNGLGSIMGFADGGRPPMNQVSVVGERGPELFVPDSAGTVISNQRSKEVMNTYNAGNTTTVAAPPTPTFKLETQVINGVEYATVDQVRQMGQIATRDGAKQGQARAMNTLKNSRSQRQKLGM
jgi:tape measure domain-containing protein